MMAEYAGITDDFFTNVDLQTTLALPRSRESVLHLCETVQKQFPTMTNLYQRDGGEHVLEGDRESGSYRWLELQARHLSAGYFNPPQLADAFGLHRWVLDSSIYFLGVSPLDVEALDVLFGFNMDYKGNRDAIVARALLAGSPLDAMASELSTRTTECEPNLVIALDEDCYMQARISVETRCNNYQVRTGEYDSEPISVYFTVRRYPRPGEVIDLKQSYDQQRRMCEDLVGRVVIPHIIEPITDAIASAP
jgi:hypothetical protein